MAAGSYGITTSKSKTDVALCILSTVCICVRSLTVSAVGETEAHRVSDPLKFAEQITDKEDWN